MIEIYGYAPAWGLPDISPYVTKVIFYMTITKIPYTYHSQDISRLAIDAPYGKLPYIIDTSNGRAKIADSNTIITYLSRRHPRETAFLSAHLTPAERAVSLAFDRLIGEHLYYSGLIEPRWRQDAGFETYVPFLTGGAEPSPEQRGFLDGARAGVLDAYRGQGMGRRDTPTVLAFYQADIDALGDYLGAKEYFMGGKVSTVDAALYATMRHCVDQPQRWEGTGYIEGKRNLVTYMERMRKQFGI